MWGSVLVGIIVVATVREGCQAASEPPQNTQEALKEATRDALMLRDHDDAGKEEEAVAAVAAAAAGAAEASTTTRTVDGTSTTEDDDRSKTPIREELNRLLSELKEVVGVLRMMRRENSQLASSVTEITSSVREMNGNIKKKVRKLSKSLNKNSHHRKVKDSLRSLQRDHELILQAMNTSCRGLNLSALESKSRSEDSSESPSSKVSSDDDDEAVNETSSEVPSSSHMESESVNQIPELVVDPPPGSSSSGKEDSKGSSASGGESDSMASTTTPSPPLPEHCTEVLQRGNYTSGVYLIQPKGLEPHKVWCDQTTQGGGWTVMVARMPLPEHEDFSRPWVDYKKGFGDPAGEYWIGNEMLHKMTKGGRHELRVNLTKWDDEVVYAQWKDFKVDSESEAYPLHVGRFSSSSTAGDALMWHDSMKFSTTDRDNDALLGGQCAQKNKAGWWYRGHRGCYQAHPTGRFQDNPGKPTAMNPKDFDLGPFLAWHNWREDSFFPKKLFLMFRPAAP
ncbi:uncharacterized protein LOC143037366 [Oratosquilla oratoria]|uniref:uncharacterized protein LOC143037366 n=1 Tax=Oratosquilla oratoria TaxID=337810 RepID=UPI003F776268